MSWGEVYKINSNMKKPINEQLRDMKYNPIRVITATGTYTPEKTGTYKVICVGKGGDGAVDKTSSPNNYRAAAGGGGGVAIRTMRLSRGTSYSVTVSTTASFADGSTIVTATGGGSATSRSGGTASGGDSNYSGTAGGYTSTEFLGATPGSVGVELSGLSCSPAPVIGTLTDNLSASTTAGAHVISLAYGRCILEYGGGGNGAAYYSNSSNADGITTPGRPAAVIIVPLEMEE